MPAIDFDIENCLLWHIAETEEELLALVPDSAAVQAREIANPRRRRHFLAGRAALHALIGAHPEIGYTEQGAPVITGSPAHENPATGSPAPGYISVSHAGDYALAGFSPTPIGVDIEQNDRNFSAVAHKYIAPGETCLMRGDYANFQAAVWCCKEALYKLAHIEGLSLADDIVLTGTDPAQRTWQGKYRRPDGTLSPAVPIEVRRLDGYTIAVATV